MYQITTQKAKQHPVPQFIGGLSSVMSATLDRSEPRTNPTFHWRDGANV